MRATFLRNWGMGVLAVLVAVGGLGCPLITSPTVPDVVGLEEAAAVTAIEDANLVADVDTAHADAVAEGLVISQDPVADTEVARGDAVAIVVSLGPSFVPEEALWVPFEDAEAAIQEQDLVVGEVTPRYDPSAPEGFVLETEPEPGTQIAVGSAVNLFVSRGPDPMVGAVQVPVTPAPLELVVDGIPRTQNVDMSDGSWQWFKFQGEAGKKYYVHSTGNGPLNMSVFIGTDVEGLETQIADMLWTTDPCYPEYEFVIDYICDPCADPCEQCEELCEECAEEDQVKVVKSEKAIMIPNFVAPETATYYVVIQAAVKETLTCLPEDCEDEITDDMLYLHYELVYYDLTTYSVQVTTNTSYEDAEMILAYDPMDPEVEPAFYQGEVRVNNHDWLAFEAEADSNYMIEFMITDLSFDYSVQATLYSPLGDVVANCFACPDVNACMPKSLYAPNAGTYYILVEVGDGPSGSGEYDPDDDLEFGQFPYILRVLEDDHGNFPSLATEIATPALDEEEVAAGYLSRWDVDAFSFKPAAYSTYRVETRGAFDLSMDIPWLEPEVDAFFEDFDGRNDMGIVQTDRSVASRYFGVAMFPNMSDPFWLQVGEYEVAVIGDDHVDDDVHNIDGTEEIPVPGSSAGILWPLDTDMLSFALDANYMHMVESTNANEQAVQVVNDEDAPTGFNVLADETWDSDQAGPKVLTSYVDPYVSGVEEDTTGYVVVGGVDEDLEEYEAEFGVSVAKGEYPVFTGVADPEAGVLPISSSLWPGENHMLVFTATKAYFWYQLTLEGADEVRAYVADEEGVLTGPIPCDQAADGKWYLQLDEVDEGGTDVYLNVWKDGGEETEYSISVVEDDHRNAGGTEAEIEATATPLTTAAAVTGVLWPEEDDLFVFDADPEKLYKVVITDLTGTMAKALGVVISPIAPIPPSEDNVTTIYLPVGTEGLQVVALSNSGTDYLYYSVELVEADDDHGDAEDDATELTEGAETAGEVWPGEVDFFAFTPTADTPYHLTVAEDAPAEVSFLASLPDEDPDPDVYAFTPATADPVYIVVAPVVPGTYTILVEDATP